MEAEYRGAWLKQAAYSLHKDDAWAEGDPALDAQALLVIIWDHWNDVFKDTLGYTERSMVSELREVRNRWAHQEAFSTDDAYRALDSVARLLTADLRAEAQEVERQKQELLRLQFEEQARQEQRQRRCRAPPKVNLPVVCAPGARSSRPTPTWPPAATCRPSLPPTSGRSTWARAATSTATRSQFFGRTFLTDGLRRLLIGAVRRLGGQGGDPVVELQTNFGGGKTHSMLALYHLFSGIRPAA